MDPEKSRKIEKILCSSNRHAIGHPLISQTPAIVDTVKVPRAGLCFLKPASGRKSHKKLYQDSATRLEIAQNGRPTHQPLRWCK
jgi:hypothetical protein